ncbi:hypothetical protein [Thermogemmatispora tikiterensis]|uniref:Uncharacterized protein n=1 Tax=Thermogemmatispora tikiterensis TaxID=1825093 RepID=A0A328VK60_9CHLR|nr:hypothetical protein [Thermogemmatispora tikiterensis]RAQ97489.1 hypothetical protein A4R35_18275 [Thermogemmatispora tikiterensis]
MLPHFSPRDKLSPWMIAPLPVMPLPARPPRPARRWGIWLVMLVLPELVGGVLLVRALPQLSWSLRADLVIALLAAAALQFVLGLALWRRAAHWWVLFAFLVVGFAWALLR